MLDDATTVADSEILLVAGDLNGHIGEDRGDFEDVIEKYGFGVRNWEGERILDFCQSKKLRVVNTMFKLQTRVVELKTELISYY